MTIHTSHIDEAPALIHIGMHKTGTTWLQRCVFPSVGSEIFATSDLHADCSVLGRNFLADLIKRDATSPQCLPRDASNLKLLSSEALVGEPFRSLLGKRAPASEIVSRVRDAFKDCRILCVRRSSGELRESLYLQYVQTGGTLNRKNFENLELNHSYLALESMLAPWEAEFDRVNVLEYDDLKTDPEKFVNAISDLSGLPLRIIDERRHNVSMKHARVRRVRYYNRFFRQTPFNPSPVWKLPKRLPYQIPGLLRDIRDVY